MRKRGRERGLQDLYAQCSQCSLLLLVFLSSSSTAVATAVHRAPLSSGSRQTIQRLGSQLRHSPARLSTAQHSPAQEAGEGRTLAHTASTATHTHTITYTNTPPLSPVLSLTLVLSSAQLLYSFAADSLAHSLACLLPVALPCCALPACLRMVQPVPGGLLSRPV